MILKALASGVARAGRGAPDRAGDAGDVPGKARLPLSRAAPAGTGRMAHPLLGRLGERSQGEVLPPVQGRSPPAEGGDERAGPDLAGHGLGAPGDIGDRIVPFLARLSSLRKNLSPQARGARDRRRGAGGPAGGSDAARRPAGPVGRGLGRGLRTGRSAAAGPPHGEPPLRRWFDPIRQPVQPSGCS